MAGETVITIIGNITADPELRYTQSGAAVVNFTIASTPRIFDKSRNEWRDADTLYMRASAWKDLAENIAESLTKGARVVVQGALKQRSYDKDGEKRTIVELEVMEIGPSLRSSVVKVSRSPRANVPGVPGGQPVGRYGYEEDVPF